MTKPQMSMTISDPQYLRPPKGGGGAGRKMGGTNRDGPKNVSPRIPLASPPPPPCYVRTPALSFLPGYSGSL